MTWPRSPARQRLIRNTFLMVSALYLSGYDGGPRDDEVVPDALAERAARLDDTSGSVIAVINAPVKKISAA